MAAAGMTTAGLAVLLVLISEHVIFPSGGELPLRGVVSFTPQIPLAVGVSRATAAVADGGGTLGVFFSHDDSRGPRYPVAPCVFSVVPRTLHMASATTSLGGSSSAASSTAGNYPLASDDEALQSLFADRCGSEGLMTEADLRDVPVIRDMLEQGDLLSSELGEIWNATPKFLGEENGEDRIDFDGFTQLYRDIDDLFEDDDDDQLDERAGTSAAAAIYEAAIPSEDAADTIVASSNDERDAVLKRAFSNLAGSIAGSISFSQLRKWEEISILIEEDGTLAEDELLMLWQNSLGVDGTDGNMHVANFMSLNNAMDDLFEDEDDVLQEDNDGQAEENGEQKASQTSQQPPLASAASLPVIADEGLPPGFLFSQLANENYLVGREELERWGELKDMLNEGDLTPDELGAIFVSVPKAPGTENMLDEDGFCSLWTEIDNLFEKDKDVDAFEASQGQKELKDELLELIDDIAKLSDQEGLLMCGLDCSELEQERVLEVASELERENYNMVAGGEGAVSKDNLVGMWDLIYSSSSTLKYNEGLSGLAGGLTKFGGLKQKLSSTKYGSKKYLSDVEYIENVIGKLGGQSFEVKISGDWDLRTEVSLFTGRPSDVLSVMPDRVTYGPRNDKADHWKSLGPMNLLVLSYLDEDLRIMRGNTSTDTLFVWRRSSQNIV